jgi:hypothetical protein
LNLEARLTSSTELSSIFVRGEGESTAAAPRANHELTRGSSLVLRHAKSYATTCQLLAKLAHDVVENIPSARENLSQCDPSLSGLLEIRPQLLRVVVSAQVIRRHRIDAATAQRVTPEVCAHELAERAIHDAAKNAARDVSAHHSHDLSDVEPREFADYEIFGRIAPASDRATVFFGDVHLSMAGHVATISGLCSVAVAGYITAVRLAAIRRPTYGLGQGRGIA